MTIPVAKSAEPRNATKEEGIDRKYLECEMEEDEVMVIISKKLSTTSNLQVD